MEQLILGIFSKHEDADSALFHLKDEGFQSDEISVITREESVERYRNRDDTSAVLTGGIVGGLGGLLISLTPVIIPGVGAVFITGPLTIITSLLVGALAGGLIGELVSIGVPEESAKVYEESIKHGGVLVAVRVNEQTEKVARRILKEHNAQEITVIPYDESIKQKLEGGVANTTEKKINSSESTQNKGSLRHS